MDSMGEKMKKVSTFMVALSVLCLSFGFMSCASIPEPSGKNKTLVYGLAEYDGSYQYAGNDTPEVTNKKSGVKLSIRHLATKRTYTRTSSSNGEFIFLNLPYGYYAIKEISTEYEYEGRKWWSSISPEKDNASARFRIREDVTNLGKIKVFADYSSGNGSATWADDFSGVQSEFSKKYPDSAWNYEDWHTFNESY